MPWVCVEKHNKAVAHYFEKGAALCGRVEDLEVGSDDGTERPPAYACGSCKRQLIIRERGVKA